jgi:hypothetical protein
VCEEEEKSVCGGGRERCVWRRKRKVCVEEEEKSVCGGGSCVLRRKRKLSDKE